MFDSINFEAQVADVFDNRGNRISPELGRGVYRQDTGDLLAICGPNFKPVQHMDIVSPILEGLAGQGYDVTERSQATRGDFEDLRGQKGAWVSSKSTDGGAVMRTDIILGDFIEPTGSASYLSDGPDTNFFRISLLNSHNSKYAVRANTSYLRLICMNGMTQPSFTAGAYGKHTSGFNLAGMQRQLTNAMEMIGEDADKFGLWARTKISIGQADQFLKATVVKLKSQPNGEANWSESLLNKILMRFRQEDLTLWGLYNAITWWQSHDAFRSNADSITAMIGREQKVASALRSPAMEEIFSI